MTLLTSAIGLGRHAKSQEQPRPSAEQQSSGTCFVMTHMESRAREAQRVNACKLGWSAVRVSSKCWRQSDKHFLSYVRSVPTCCDRLLTNCKCSSTSVAL